MPDLRRVRRLVPDSRRVRRLVRDRQFGFDFVVPIRVAFSVDVVVSIRVALCPSASSCAHSRRLRLRFLWWRLPLQFNKEFNNFNNISLF